MGLSAFSSYPAAGNSATWPPIPHSGNRRRLASHGAVGRRLVLLWNGCGDSQFRDRERAGIAAANRPSPESAWHPRGRALAVGFDGHPIRLYDRATWQVYRTLKTDQSVTMMAFNHAGDKLVCTGWQGHLELFDPHRSRTDGDLFDEILFPFQPDDLRLAGSSRWPDWNLARLRRAGFRSLIPMPHLKQSSTRASVHHHADYTPSR